MGVTRSRRALAAAALAILPLMSSCGFAAEDPAERPDRASAEEAAARSRERVQAYLDAVTAKDVAAGRSQLCATMYEGFDAAATGPNGDFADHFTISETGITDVRPSPQGQEVSTSVTVAVGAKETIKPLLFTVTRSGADWCISGETPGGHTPAPAVTP